MISKDQPAVFPPYVVTAVSSTQDGNMKYLDSTTPQIEVDQNRALFLKKQGIDPDQTVLIRTTYDGNNYTRYHEVKKSDHGQGITRPSQYNSDSLATREKNVALFLPIADCIGGFVYDPARHVIMVMHLGRQATEQHGARKSIEFMRLQFGSNPKDLLVWLGPAPSEKTYPLYSFDSRSLHDINTEHLRSAGVDYAKITICRTDTIIDANYFSHSAFLKGKRETDGRYAVVAMLK